MGQKIRSIQAAGWLLAGLAAGCGPLGDAAEKLFDPRTPRERYADGLRAAGLGGTALVEAWLAAGERAVRMAPVVGVPHAEQGYLPPGEPAALGFRVAVRRGQEVRFDFTLTGDTLTRAFLDAWTVDSTGVERLAAGDSGARSLVVEPRRDGEIVFRVQLELLRGGRFEARVGAAPLLAFPVAGGRNQDIGSDWGAPRDAGARSHHGIDIFAPRGTAALAGADGRISRVETTTVGGKVVWLRDERGNAHYFAHLDSQTVVTGARVRRGDTVGLVGNTGNAARTPPHLHFGIYRRGEGPINPGGFVRRLFGSLPRLVADTALAGGLARTRSAEVPVQPAADRRPDPLQRLPRHTALRVLAATGAWLRVVLPDGSGGFVASTSVEPLAGPVATSTAPEPRTGLLTPEVPRSPDAVVTLFAPGARLGVLGRFGGYALVETPAGLRVWVAD